MCISKNDPDQLSHNYPGTVWELRDKMFAPYYNATTEDGVIFTQNSTNVKTVSNAIINRSGHEIGLTFSFTSAVALTDGEFEIGTFNLNTLGISSLPWTLRHCTFNDAGQVVVSWAINAAGKMTSNDVMVRGSSTASIAAGTSFYFTITFNCRNSHMLDSACNQFYFERIA